MVEVFKTNVGNEESARQIILLLGTQFPACRSNFDLEDADCILRVEGEKINAPAIAALLGSLHFHCEPLPD